MTWCRCASALPAKSCLQETKAFQWAKPNHFRITWLFTWKKDVIPQTLRLSYFHTKTLACSEEKQLLGKVTFVFINSIYKSISKFEFRHDQIALLHPLSGAGTTTYLLSFEGAAHILWTPSWSDGVSCTVLMSFLHRKKLNQFVWMLLLLAAKRSLTIFAQFENTLRYVRCF